jgi:hypothetical protein
MMFFKMTRPVLKNMVGCPPTMNIDNLAKSHVSDGFGKRSRSRLAKPEE